MPGTERAKHGGQAVLEKYGPDFYARIGKKGGAVIAARGSEFFSEIGRKGGNATKARHGVEHYEKIGAVGGVQSGESYRRRHE